jgi:hypothetical protein
MLDLSATLDPGTPLGELESLAWAGMSEDELVDRLANEVWKRPAHYSGNKLLVGRLGITESKVKKFVDRFARSLPQKKRRKLYTRVFDETTKIFEDYLVKWSWMVLVVAGYPTSKLAVNDAVTRIVPRGARKQVRVKVGEHLGWNLPKRE